MKKYIEIPFKKHTLRGFHHTVESDVCLVMLHGFTGNCNENGRFKGISEMAEQNKIDSIRVDFLCHGESDLSFKDMRFGLLVEQGKTILQYARSLGYKKVYLLGYSMGGLTALHLLDQKIDKLILMSPAFGFKKNVERRFEHAIKLPNGDVDYGARVLSRKFVDSLKEINELLFSTTFKKEILLVMGSDDDVINIEQAMKDMKKFQSTTTKLIDYCGHGYNSIESRKQLNKSIRDFLIIQ